MAEAGVDISGQRSQRLDETGLDFDLVVTVCDHAAESCPLFPGSAKVLHQAASTIPPRLAADAASEQEALGHYRRVRDEIREYVAGLPQPGLSGSPGIS